MFFYLLVGNTNLLTNNMTAMDWSVAGAIAVGIMLIVVTSPSPVTYCDTSPDRLDRIRVSAGLIVGSLLAFQALLANGPAGWLDTSIWACVVAVLLSFAIRRASSAGRHGGSSPPQQ